MSNTKPTSADPSASFRGPTPSEVDARFAEAERALQTVAPRDTLRTAVPVAENLAVGPHASVASNGRQAAGAYVGPTEIVPTPGVEHPAARVLVGDPSQRAVTQRMLRPVPLPVGQLPMDQAEQGLVTPVDAVKVQRPAKRAAVTLAVLGMAALAVAVGLWSKGGADDGKGHEKEEVRVAAPTLSASADVSAASAVATPTPPPTVAAAPPSSAKGAPTATATSPTPTTSPHRPPAPTALPTSSAEPDPTQMPDAPLFVPDLTPSH